MRRTALGLMVTALAAPAHGEASRPMGVFFTGNMLFDTCGSRNAAQRQECLGYISGIADEYALFRYKMKQAPCAPEGVNGEQIREIAIAFMRRNADIRERDAAEMVTGAIVETWCPTGAKP